MVYKFGNNSYDFSEKIFIIGVFNITADSFSDGGKYYDGKPLEPKILNDALKMQSEGADFIDVGGESTRPGSEQISVDEEISRVIPVIRLLKKYLSIPVSIDTYKSVVAEEALKEGADIVNDISGFKFDPALPDVTSKYNAGCILMHIKGTPKNMQLNPVYKNVVSEVYRYLEQSVSIAKEAGIKNIIIDPGIGFGKTLEHNLTLINNLFVFHDLGCPVLLGLSNKSFIDKISPTPVELRLGGTIAANSIGIYNGANIIRVHSVLENKKAAEVAFELMKNKNIRSKRPQTRMSVLPPSVLPNDG
jgi:dihydropteroate synthase